MVLMPVGIVQKADSTTVTVLNGSYARGDSSEDSDIDIAAIVHGSRIELQKKLKELWNTAAALSLDYGIIISPTVIPYDEYETYKTSLPYYRNITQEF